MVRPRRLMALLVATFALLLIPLISVPATTTIYFAEATSSVDAWNIRVGTWGACSPGISFGYVPNNLHSFKLAALSRSRSGERNIRGCTSSSGAYDLSAELPLTQTDSTAPPQQIHVHLLSGSQTGPLICGLVAFIMLVPATGLWIHEVFSAVKKPLVMAVSRKTPWSTFLQQPLIDCQLCFICLTISTILAWVTLAEAGKVAGKLDDGLDAYRSNSAAALEYATHRGNAVWCCLAGAVRTQSFLSGEPLTGTQLPER